MSRRDTIIVAVLVNAGLLMILFATAVRSDKKTEPAAPKHMELAHTSTPVVKSDQVDDFFDQYISPVPVLNDLEGEPIALMEEIPLSLPVSAPEPVIEKKIVEATPAPLHTPAKVTPAFVDVTVKKGDYLEKIANANNTTIAAIVQANNLSSTQLKIGQVLKVPLSSGAVKKKVTTPLSSDAEFYVVKEGDSPWLIASRNKIRLDDLLRLNDLDEQKARRLRPGDRLKIR